MADEPVPLTADGKARLSEELEGLRGQRKVVAERIHNARELGTSQNDAEYEDAKLEQGKIEGRILELEDILRRATIIDEGVAHHAGRVVLGSGIHVEQDGKKQHYQIVGHPESDPANGKISNESPVGAALLGKKVGDVVDVNVPKGVIKIKLLKID
jgi:transcription elongation factor GreA